MRKQIGAVVLCLLGCGAADHPGSSAPPCDDVAEHLVRLSERDNAAAAEPGLAAGMKAEFARQCKENPWSRERRECLASARTQDGTLECPRD